MSRVSGSAKASDTAIAAATKVLLENDPFVDPLTIRNLNNSFAGGNTWTYHVQAVGFYTIFKDDTSLISASDTKGPVSQMELLVLTNVMVPREKWRLDSALKLLRFGQDASVKSLATVQYIVSPTIRASYHLHEKATIEAEVGLDVTHGNSGDPAILGQLRTCRDFSFIADRLDI